MTERENLPAVITAQAVAMMSEKRGSLVARGLVAVQESKKPELDADEKYRLGLKYEHGEGVPQDYKEAVKWYRLAAEQGCLDAQTGLGFIYSFGSFYDLDIPKDYNESVKWYLLAAEQGDHIAQTRLGMKYGERQNYMEAMRWYQLAADQGNSDAQLHLGVMYENGKGVPQDHAEAVKCYRLAAHQGHPLAKEALDKLGID
jgi:TPR repeat protein